MWRGSWDARRGSAMLLYASKLEKRKKRSESAMVVDDFGPIDICFSCHIKNISIFYTYSTFF